MDKTPRGKCYGRSSQSTVRTLTGHLTETGSGGWPGGLSEEMLLKLGVNDEQELTMWRW